jgi:spermidine/putrescine transport system ATP-binding protein
VTRPVVEIVGVGKRFGDHIALHRIDLTVGEGEFVSLLGPSGCGKTTLLRIVSGFEQQTVGQVLIHGTDVSSVPPERRPTNIVFQRGALFPHMNVFDNIAYSLRLRKWSKDRIAARVEEMLGLVRLTGLGQRGPTELSGGQVQRAALARALAPEPTVLLLDEPLSALDLKLRQHMQLELRAIQRKLGATFLYVTHDQTEALAMSDRIAVMNDGRILQEGTPREIYSRPTSVFASDFIGETNLFRGTVATVEGPSITIALSDGTIVPAHAPNPITGGVLATLSVRPESIRLLAGAEGAGMAASLRGTIAEIVYLGSRVRIGTATTDGSVVWADLRDAETEGLGTGDSVSLSWSTAAATAWADTADEALSLPAAEDA